MILDEHAASDDVRLGMVDAPGFGILEQDLFEQVRQGGLVPDQRHAEANPVGNLVVKDGDGMGKVIHGAQHKKNGASWQSQTCGPGPSLGPPPRSPEKFVLPRPDRAREDEETGGGGSQEAAASRWANGT